jgi:hypothetical protein
VDDNHRRGAIARWWLTAAAIVVVAGISFVLFAPDGLVDWFPVQATTGSPLLVPGPAPLPVPSPMETYVRQARAMFAGGKLRDALRALDRVPVGDALRPEAERLRADIQRELLAVAGAEASSTPPAATRVSPPKE